VDRRRVQPRGGSPQPPGGIRRARPHASAELIEKLGTTVRETEQVLLRLTEADLLAEYDIQGYRVHGLDDVYQVIEHFGLHYGQIAYITKMLRAEDLGFYRELDKTGRA
jgi:hypothetical protein